MIQHYLIFIYVISGAFLSVRTRKLTLVASLTGSLISLLIYIGIGIVGIVMLSAFFLLGTLATLWKRQEKRKFDRDESSVRKAGQVFANAGVAAILGLLAVFFPESKVLFTLMLAAAFSSATADTLSSELGNIYGRRFYNILNLKRDKKGLDGVVSLEGTFFGLIGSSFIALIYACYAGPGLDLLWIIIAGTLGNFSDSILGASLERKKILNNNAVNFLNTALAAMW